MNHKFEYSTKYILSTKSFVNVCKLTNSNNNENARVLQSKLIHTKTNEFTEFDNTSRNFFVAMYFNFVRFLLVLPFFIRMYSFIKRKHKFILLWVQSRIMPRNLVKRVERIKAMRRENKPTFRD